MQQRLHTPYQIAINLCRPHVLLWAPHTCIFKVFIPINSLSRIQNMPCKYCWSALYAYACCSYNYVYVYCICCTSVYCICCTTSSCIAFSVLLYGSTALLNMEVYIKIQNLDSNSNYHVWNLSKNFTGFGHSASNSQCVTCLNMVVLG